MDMVGDSIGVVAISRKLLRCMNEPECHNFKKYITLVVIYGCSFLESPISLLIYTDVYYSTGQHTNKIRMPVSKF